MSVPYLLASACQIYDSVFFLCFVAMKLIEKKPRVCKASTNINYNSNKLNIQIKRTFPKWQTHSIKKSLFKNTRPYFTTLSLYLACDFWPLLHERRSKSFRHAVPSETGFYYLRKKGFKYILFFTPDSCTFLKFCFITMAGFYFTSGM